MGASIYMCNTLKTLTRQTRNRAKGKGNKNPDKMLRNIDPGIAKVCKLFNKLRKTRQLHCIIINMVK